MAATTEETPEANDSPELREDEDPLELDFTGLAQELDSDEPADDAEESEEEASSSDEKGENRTA